MQKTQMIIQEMEKLVCSKVVIFGQVSPFHIRIVDVLKELQPYELENDEAENIDNYLDYLDALFGLKKIEVNNSYKWNAPVDYDFNYYIYQDQINNRYLVKFRVDYTDSVLYSFEHIDDFFATVAQAGYYKKLGKYFLEACPLQEGWRLYNEEGEEIEQLFDEQDILERL